MNKILLSILCILLVFESKSQAPFRLRCDLLLNTSQVYQKGIPVNEPLESAITQKQQFQFAFISNKQPHFSWEIVNSVGKVTAYRVLLASNAQMLKQNKADFWDSKRTNSNQNKAIYNGKLLEPGKIYYWKVQVWDDKGKVSEFSKTSSFYLDSPDETQPFAYQPLAAEIQEPTQIIQTGPDSYFLDFGKDALGQLTLCLTSLESDSVWVEVGEVLESPARIQKNAGRNIRYLKLPLFIKPGTHDYDIVWETNEKRNSRNPILMPDYIGEVYPFRYISIHNFKGTINKQSVKRKTVFYPFDENASSFTSSDTVLNQIWDLCKYSMKATSFTGFYVDGDRERIPYEADALINQLSHYAVDAEYSIGRRSMDYLIYHPTWPTEWSLQNVLIAWNDYLYTGDTTFLKNYYADLRNKALIPLEGKGGLISTRTNKQTDEFLKTIHITKTFDNRRGLHDIVDWPQNGDVIGDEKEYKGENDGFVFNTYNSVINAYYYRNLVLLQKIATVLGKNEEAQAYEAKAKKVYNSFLQTFQDTKTGIIKDGDSTNHTSLHANMFAMAFGLVPKKDLTNVVQFIKSRKMACSVYGSQFLMDALYEAGEADYGLELLSSTAHRSWYNMIRVGSTISLEAWDKVYKPNLDWNHAWGSVPANIIVRKLMGVEPITPGFETFQIKPQFGSLTSASLQTPTIKGPVSVSFNKGETSTTMKVIIPGGTHADIYVPADGKRKTLSINGQSSNIKAQSGYYLLPHTKPGSYAFILN
ncbi:alpha-L-rhamnosidase C-terminal domain-containing protein [Emticicia sp. BO119]|uniref:alpha-L-rhamnosidase-related protein n=1 Tax=Emticicia sp. BO119 TaxID=2757768 RepID=UPI0015F0E395|nr:alpha-L-rhamnosidase C-terminal domain-containing protein [Emticicia sp. BO119]MBA4850177.1 alpha-L-rhamnosidase [Emticicia sp. BO119]